MAPPPTELHVAVAADLSPVFSQIYDAYLTATRIRLMPNFAPGAQLAKQIESGIAFDVFLASDSDYPRALAAAGLADEPRVYARSRLAVWAPRHPEIRSLQDFGRGNLQKIAIPNPDVSAFGRAAKEALENLHLWEKVGRHANLTPDASAAVSYVDNGQADAAVTAYPLIASRNHGAAAVPDSVHLPVPQSLCLLRRTSQPQAAQTFVDFVLSEAGRRILEKNGYEAP